MRRARVLSSMLPLAVLLPEPPATQVIFDEEIGVVVPAPGETVWAETLEADGDVDLLVVTRLPDGRVVVEHVGDDGHDGQAPAAALASLPPCVDPAFVPFSHVVEGRYRWSFRSSSVPSNLSSTKVTAALKRAAANVVGTENDCGLPDVAGVGHAYQGSVARGPDISNSSVCQTRDAVSVVGFGDLASSNLGFACWWTSGGVVVEADVKLNRVDHAWTIAPGASCKGRYAVEAVATHEFGHVFGLDHVSEDPHGALTMSPLIEPCQSSESTLGAGDVAGLALKYATA